MLDKADVIIQLVTEQATQTAALQAQIAALQTKNAAFQTKNAAFQTESAAFQAEQRAVNEVLQEKLGRIEANVIVIKGIVLSNFEGVSESTKEEIQQAAEVALEEKEVIVGAKHFFEPSHPAYKTPEFKAIRKEIKENNIKGLVLQYTPDPAKGLVNSVGQWVNAQMSLIFGETLKGKYDDKVMPLVASLVGFYMVERIANGRLF